LDLLTFAAYRIAIVSPTPMPLIAYAFVDVYECMVGKFPVFPPTSFMPVVAEIAKVSTHIPESTNPHGLGIP